MRYTMERAVIELFNKNGTTVHINAYVPVVMTETDLNNWVKVNIEYVRWVSQYAPTPSLLVIPHGNIAHA